MYSLSNLWKKEFKFGEDETGRFVQYNDRLSKNYNVSLDQYQDEHFRLAVIEHDQDMVATLKAPVDHLPVSGTFLFYQPIDNPRMHTWNSMLFVSAKKLTGCLKEIHQECGFVT